MTNKTTYDIEFDSIEYQLISCVEGMRWGIDSGCHIIDEPHTFRNFVCSGTYRYCQAIKERLELKNKETQ
jgi:hypothetical protein